MPVSLPAICLKRAATALSSMALAVSTLVCWLHSVTSCGGLVEGDHVVPFVFSLLLRFLDGKLSSSLSYLGVPSLFLSRY